MSNQKYVIVVGPDRPATIIGQALEKGSGQTITAQGGDTRHYINRRADIVIPNRSEQWGVRLDRDGNMPKDKLEVKDPNYKGKIKFLPWGHQDGEKIVTRYLSGYNSLDLLYQELVLNASTRFNEFDESIADAFWIRLLSGENEFDEVQDEYKVLMLKHHHYNKDCKTGNPEFYNHLFHEKKEEVVSDDETEVLLTRSDAVQVVKQAAADGSLDLLRNLKNILNTHIESDVKDKELFATLLKFANNKPSTLLSEVERYKKSITNLVQLAKSKGAIDLTKEGTIVAGLEKKEIIAEKVEGKGEKMLAWLLDNYLTPTSFEAMFKLKQIIEKTK